MRRLLLLTGFFIIAPLALLLTFLFYLSLSYHNTSSQSSLSVFSSVPNQTVSYAALQTSYAFALDKIEINDSRVDAVHSFFSRYGSPLLPYAKDIVASADLYDLDFRLLPAIAMQESNLCKKSPKNSYNCWGFGVYGKKVIRFENYPEAIRQVSKTLARDYKQKGMDTPEEIMKVYAPSNDGAWATSVNHFMNELR